MRTRSKDLWTGESIVWRYMDMAMVFKDIHTYVYIYIDVYDSRTTYAYRKPRLRHHRKRRRLSLNEDFYAKNFLHVFCGLIKKFLLE